jgi:hypothetical protein
VVRGVGASVGDHGGVGGAFAVGGGAGVWGVAEPDQPLLARYAVEGEAVFESRSRWPKTSPQATRPGPSGWAFASS